MYQEKRPTCVTVIGWSWIIIGGLMFLSAIMALLSSTMMGQMSSAHPASQHDLPIIFKFIHLMSTIQIVIAITGFVSGINFLKLKGWSRISLEVLTWILLVFVVGFGIYWEYGWLTMTSGRGPQSFDIMGAVMGLIIFGFYGIPLGIMLKYLRGNKVKSALAGTAEQVAGADGEKHRRNSFRA